MSTVVDRKEVDTLTGWPKVKVLRALADDCEARASRRGSWLLAPIRFLRCQFRRLEVATRPQE